MKIPPSPNSHQSIQRKKNTSKGNVTNKHNPKNDHSTITYFKSIVKSLFTLISGKTKTTSEAVENDSTRNNKVRGVSSSTTDVSSDGSKGSSKWKPSQTSASSSTSNSLIGKGNFTFEELYKATGKFSQDNIIGEGAFGIVYKGKLYDGTLVAVKCARKDVQKKHLAEFKNEINTLSKIEHLNLVRWYGYLEHGDDKIIVIEYVNNGTLREHLDGVRGNVLEVGERLDIAIDIAHAITYLHMYTDDPIIHRDIKASNILITDRLRAKVADFGFARLAPDDPNATHISTQVKGTAGRHPVEPQKPLDERVTIKWAMQLLKQGEAVIAMDPRLRRNSTSNKAVQKVFKLAFQCLAPVRRLRPSMKNCQEVLWEIRKEFRDKGFSRPPPIGPHRSADFPQKDSRKKRHKTFGIEDDKKIKFVSA
ncbi:non-specific serine/threonine protein kinase [Trifolium repens]|nr:non-specific serine/threonine protein kinase [Trifolium repens]